MGQKEEGEGPVAAAQPPRTGHMGVWGALRAKLEAFVELFHTNEDCLLFRELLCPPFGTACLTTASTSVTSVMSSRVSLQTLSLHSD